MKSPYQEKIYFNVNNNGALLIFFFFFIIFCMRFIYSGLHFVATSLLLIFMSTIKLRILNFFIFILFYSYIDNEAKQKTQRKHEDLKIILRMGINSADS